MTSEPIPTPREAFVWVWLPGGTEPVVAGRLVAEGGEIAFVYGRSYRALPGAIPLYLPELPLRAGLIRPLNGLPIASAIRDAAPDAWGRRVILNRAFGLKGPALDGVELDELSFLLQSGSDRVGALDFQTSATDYVPRGGAHASLADLLASAEKVEKNLPLSPELDQALHHGSSIGGARPKALISDGPAKYVAKFSSGNDTYSVVKAEYIAMRLAALAGLNVAPVRLARASGKDVLLVERFDREADGAGWRRRAMVSALTMLGLDEMQARYASYQDLAEIVRFRFTRAPETLRELFARICFNILVGNLDDHARNHAAFWDGEHLTLTPAYDICPQGRAGEEASQAMLIVDQNRASQIATCLVAAPHFQLDGPSAVGIVERQIRAIGDHWTAICDEAALGEVDRTLFWGRQFLNPYAFYGLEGGPGEALAALAGDYRRDVA
ncbi:phosphatidylinositol kinase [Brevundimonas sp. LM2]|uniref:type II toxin-antitoxin system HipA family toxin n=1 Tax=Brevundimonas sp. LM2 TaxID=1938605 RepID=UPI000983CB9F|nr:type II toxin-antitoxin system HipA family toxin [Brevundimonas sp. LM2]AQR62061.1 phosphatidylinositol kinase [Brevundimonas sp. LM2]